MSIYAHLLGTSDIELWGLTSRERLRRQIAELPDAVLVDELDSLREDATLLCIRADYLFESRTIKALAERGRAVLRCTKTGEVAAAVGAAGEAEQLVSLLDGATTDHDLPTLAAADLAAYEDRLRKAEEPLLLPIAEQDRAELEDRLYGRSYKGITDLVTKWLWPRPARHAVRVCAQLGITPNMVTLTGLLLVVYAGFAFYHGDYWLGLAAGWFMTFLDTVDGKLARVTVSSSRIGHVLDHGMDIVHPPFWYVLWGMSLDESLFSVPLLEYYWWIVAGYVGGRLIEAAFHGLGSSSLFDWRPFDAYFRLVTARRNPCLILMLVAMLLGSPAGAFLAVVFWTVGTTVVLMIRLLQATLARMSDGPLSSWLTEPSAATRYPRAFRTFSRTRGAYVQR
jgi:phosphatidylglycerophosphate synthase